MESNTQASPSTHRCWKTSKTYSLNGNTTILHLLIKFKFEFANVFWTYKTWVENQSGCRMQIIRSDNWKEYTCDSSKKFYDKIGIEHQFSTSYIPQQNVKSERKTEAL